MGGRNEGTQITACMAEFVPFSNNDTKRDVALVPSDFVAQLSDTLYV